MKEKVSFVVILRAIACIFVVIAHYIGLFGISGVHTIFSQFLPRTSSSAWAQSFIVAFSNMGINFGALGVSIFFLITGFLCVMSLEKDCTWHFLLKKAVRLYPVYIVSVMLLYLASILYTNWAGTAMPAPFSHFLIQASLLRDWAWIPSVDGIGWTLEVQLKMYIIYFLLYRLHLLDKCKSVILLVIAATGLLLLAKPFQEGLLATNVDMYVCMYVAAFSALFIIYGLVGVAFYQWYTGKWTIQECIATIILCLFSFAILSTGSMVDIKAQVLSYMYAVAVCGIVFLLKDSMSISPLITWFADISYSFYAVHGLMGYYLLSVLEHYNVRFYMSVLITFFAAVLAAYILNKFVEKPCAKLSRRYLKKSRS